MHGNVEEWCYDWYGPYCKGRQVDPMGYVSGDFKITRGGSHGTDIYYLRSGNRMGTLPENKHWQIGFRIVIGELPKTKPASLPIMPMIRMISMVYSPTVSLDLSKAGRESCGLALEMGWVNSILKSKHLGSISMSPIIPTVYYIMI